MRYMNAIALLTAVKVAELGAGSIVFAGLSSPAYACSTIFVCVNVIRLLLTALSLYYAALIRASFLIVM